MKDRTISAKRCSEERDCGGALSSHLCLSASSLRVSVRDALRLWTCEHREAAVP